MKYCKAVVIDIETKASITDDMREILERDLAPAKNLKDEEKIKNSIEKKRMSIYEKAALSPLTAEVAIFGCAVEYHNDSNTEIKIFSANEYHDEEKELLRAITEFMASKNDATIVTFNGRSFDLPFLAARYVINNLSSYPWPLGYQKNHIDLRDLIIDGSLEKWAVAIGMGKKAAPSAEIPAIIASGDWETAREHCYDDVSVTLELYRRFEAAGRLNR